MAKHLGRKCKGGHKHVQLAGGTRATKAAVYSQEFAMAIVEGDRLHRAATQKSKRKGNRLKQKCSLKLPFD